MPSDYKRLNLIALGGTLVYAGYLLGSIEKEDSIATAVNSAFTNSDDDTKNSNNNHRQQSRLRPASPSSSWDTRLVENESWDIGISEEDQDDILILPNVHVEKTPKFAKGPVINSRDNRKASTINLIGERHSGTNWITDHLVDCFGGQIEVSVIVCAV